MKPSFLYTLPLALAVAAEEVQLEERAAFQCDAKNIRVRALDAAVRSPLLFCMWWRGNKDKSSSSPFTALSNTDIDQTCKCIRSKPGLGRVSTMPPPGKGSSDVKNLVALDNDVASPQQFCKYWNKSTDKDASPFTDLSPSDLITLCKEIAKNPKALSTTPATGSSPAKTSGAKGSESKGGDSPKQTTTKATGKGQSVTVRPTTFSTMKPINNETAIATKKTTVKKTTATSSRTARLTPVGTVSSSVMTKQAKKTGGKS